MLVRPGDYVKASNILGGWHIGRVIHNLDDLLLGGIKVWVPGLLEFDYESSPWIFPLRSMAPGGSLTSANVFIPEVGAQVVITFPYNDVYTGFYIGYVEGVLTQNAKLISGYPNSWGWEDSSGNYMFLDKATGAAELRHASGAKIVINAAGEITITANKITHIKGTLS